MTRQTHLNSTTSLKHNNSPSKPPGTTGFRIVHVSVPETVFNHAKAQAYLSNLTWSDYLARLLSEAQPFAANTSPPTEGPRNDVRSNPNQP